MHGLSHWPLGKTGEGTTCLQLCQDDLLCSPFPLRLSVPKGGVLDYKHEDESELKEKHPFDYVTTTKKEEIPFH